MISDEKAFKILIRLLVQVPGGAYSTDAWVGRCGLGVEPLTQFKTKFSDITFPFKIECEIFRPYLRHSTQNQWRPFADLGFADYFYFI